MLPNEITIKVTDDHIRKGVRLSCRYCPIALALRDALEYSNPYVESDDFYPHAESMSFVSRYNMPDSAKEFIRKYDHRELVQPFEFIATKEYRD